MACNWNWAYCIFFTMFLVTVSAILVYNLVDSRYRKRCGMDFPHLYIESASLDYPNASTIGEWTLGISVKNPNRCNKIIYDEFRAYLSQEGAGICIYTKKGAINQLIQFPLNKTLASVNPKGWRMVDNPSVGAGYINVTLETYFFFELYPKIKLLSAAGSHYGRFWLCQDVPVRFHGKGGIMTGTPVSCEDPGYKYDFYRSPHGCIYRS